MGSDRKIAVGELLDAQSKAARRDLMLTVKPQDLPDNWFEMWESLITDMRREAQALPLKTAQLILIERLATLYVRVRMLEESPRAADWEQVRDFNRLIIRLGGEIAAQINRHSMTPEQRFVGQFKAAINAAMKEVGPDATVRELLPVLADHLREYDL